MSRKTIKRMWLFNAWAIMELIDFVDAWIESHNTPPEWMIEQ